MTRVALYLRISEDPNDTRLGVARQREDGRAVAERRGWTVVDDYEDNDVSAYRKNVTRPRFEQMLTDLSAGHLEGIVVYDLDRLARQPRDLERLIDIYEDGRDLVFASVEGDIDLQSTSGRTLARVMTAFANKSSADTGRRVARKHLELAKAGKPVGTRTFGWLEDRETLHPEESALARAAVDSVLGGASLRSIVRGWNALGVKTAKGNDWEAGSLRFYLRNPRLVGWRTYRGEVLRGEDHEPVQGTWEPMIDLPTWERLQAVVRKPDTRSRVPRRDARRYLLTGLLRCGHCGGPMYGNHTARGAGYVYRCDSRPANTITGPPVDDFVAELAYRAVANLDPKAQPQTFSGEGRITEIGERVAELMTEFSKGTISGAVALPAVQALEEERGTLERERSQWFAATAHTVHKRVTREEWESWDNAGRRNVIDALVSGVLIRPLNKRSNTVDLSRIEIVWKATS